MLIHFLQQQRLWSITKIRKTPRDSKETDLIEREGTWRRVLGRRLWLQQQLWRTDLQNPGEMKHWRKRECWVRGGFWGKCECERCADSDSGWGRASGWIRCLMVVMSIITTTLIWFDLTVWCHDDRLPLKSSTSTSHQSIKPFYEPAEGVGMRGAHLEVCDWSLQVLERWVYNSYWTHWTAPFCIIKF